MRLLTVFGLMILMAIQQQIFNYDRQRVEGEREEERDRLALLITVVEHKENVSVATRPKLLRACPVPTKLSKLYHSEWEIGPIEEH